MNVSRIKLAGVALVIVAVTIWVHWPSTRGEFLDVDDKEYLQQSRQWNGLTWDAVKWAFTATDPYYHPLPRLSHVLDYELFGANAVGHHATSVVVHALNAALVFGFLWTLLGAVSVTADERLAIAAAVAGAFAIHPFQVESVAWIAGRTQLLCATFGIGCLWAYVVGPRRWMVWGLFALALLCKPTAVSLPFVMLALDYYPLRRHERLGWGKLLLEKAPMIALSVVVGAVTTVTETELAPLGMAPLSDRVLMTFQSLVFYPWRLVCPWHLAPFYPLRLRPSLGEWKVIVSVLSVGMITALAVWKRRRVPVLLAAWGAYAAFVLPVSGLTQGLGAVAPRHAYVAVLPLLLLIAVGAVWVWRRLATAAQPLLIALVVCELCVFGARARSSIPEWHSEETLRRAVLVSFPDSEFDNRMLALTLAEQGRLPEALEYAKRGIEIAPEQSLAHMTLGNVYCRLGQLPEAQAEYEQAFRTSKDPPLAHYNYGVGLMQLGKVPEAAEHFEQALQAKLNTPMAHYNLGYALYQMGRAPEAIKEFEVALQIWPNCAEAHNGLGSVLLRTGNVPDAIAHLEKALRINPDYAQAHYNLGIALAQAGRLPEAMEQWQEAVRLKPDDVESRYNLGIALQQQGRVPEAIAQFEQILNLRPDYTDARNALARLRAGQ